MPASLVTLLPLTSLLLVGVPSRPDTSDTAKVRRGAVRETSNDSSYRVWDTYLDSGLLLHVTRDLQVDGGAYFGVSGAAPLLTLFTGLSIRQ